MLQIPGMPKTGFEFSQLIHDSRYSNMHNATVCVDNSVGIIFVRSNASSKVLQANLF